MRLLIANPSDLHGGSSVGLCPPGMRVHTDADNKGKIWDLLPHQEYLWYEKWLPDWGYVLELKRSLDALLVVAVGGDLVDNVHHRTVQLVSHKPEDHIRIAFNALEIPAAIADKFVICRGTPAHAGQGASREELIADMLMLKFPNLNITTHYIWEPTLGGVKFNFAHHGSSPGIRKHTEGNVLRHNTKSVMSEYITRGDVPPRVFSRSHYHKALHETIRIKVRGGAQYVTEAILNPAYCGVTEHAFKVKVERELILCDNGMYLYYVEGGKLQEVISDLVVGHNVVDEEVWP